MPVIEPVVGASVDRQTGDLLALRRGRRCASPTRSPSRSNVSVYWPGVGSVRTVKAPTSSSVRLTVDTSSVAAGGRRSSTPPSGPAGLVHAPGDDAVALAQHDLDALERPGPRRARRRATRWRSPACRRSAGRSPATARPRTGTSRRPTPSPRRRARWRSASATPGTTSRATAPVGSAATTSPATLPGPAADLEVLERRPAAPASTSMSVASANVSDSWYHCSANPAPREADAVAPGRQAAERERAGVVGGRAWPRAPCRCRTRTGRPARRRRPAPVLATTTLPVTALGVTDAIPPPPPPGWVERLVEQRRRRPTTRRRGGRRPCSARRRRSPPP